jgi:hypothetical protein
MMRMKPMYYYAFFSPLYNQIVIIIRLIVVPVDSIIEGEGPLRLC